MTKITIDRATVEQVLEALSLALSDVDWRANSPTQPVIHKAHTALRAALAEPVQEPVALDWLHKWANQDDGEPETQWHEGYEAARRVVQIHLTAPPQPLTEEEIWELYYALPSDDFERSDRVDFARAIEQAHGIKEGT